MYLYYLSNSASLHRAINIEQSSQCIIYCLLQFTHCPDFLTFVGITQPVLGAFTCWAIVSSARCSSSYLISIQAEKGPESTSHSTTLSAN